jgi:quinol monooxygenase YgiN
MTVLRHYTMTAVEGRADDLRVALQGLAAKVGALPQSLKVELFSDPDAPGTFVFIEHWASVADHKQAGAMLGKEAFAPVAVTLAAPPLGRYLIAVE